jgi:carboxylesterase type B
VLTAGDPREAGFTYTDADHQLADQMSSYWANFAATGNPNGPGLPEWQPYDSETEPYLEFGGPNIGSGRHLFKEQLDFQDEVTARTLASP